MLRLVLVLSVGILASLYAQLEAKKDLQNSRVKLAGRDVLLSKKIVFSIAAVPVLWVFYAVLLLCFSNFEKRLIMVRGDDGGGAC